MYSSLIVMAIAMQERPTTYELPIVKKNTLGNMHPGISRPRMEIPTSPLVTRPLPEVKVDDPFAEILKRFNSQPSHPLIPQIPEQPVSVAQTTKLTRRKAPARIAVEKTRDFFDGIWTAAKITGFMVPATIGATISQLVMPYHSTREITTHPVIKPAYINLPPIDRSKPRPLHHEQRRPLTREEFKAATVAHYRRLHPHDVRATQEIAAALFGEGVRATTTNLRYAIRRHFHELPYTTQQMALKVDMCLSRVPEYTILYQQGTNIGALIENVYLSLRATETRTQPMKHSSKRYQSQRTPPVRSSSSQTISAFPAALRVTEVKPISGVQYAQGIAPHQSTPPPQERSTSSSSIAMLLDQAAGNTDAIEFFTDAPHWLKGFLHKYSQDQLHEGTGARRYATAL